MSSTKGQSAAKLQDKVNNLIDNKIRIAKRRFNNEELSILLGISENISEACYMIRKGLKNKPVCPECGRQLKFRCLSLGYRRFCSVHCKNIWYVHNTNINSKISASVIKYHDALPEIERSKQQKLRLQTMEDRGIMIPRSSLSDIALYKIMVKKFTERTLISKDPRRCTSVHLDHMYSIVQGFKDCIPPWIIGSEVNLRLISRSENTSKNYKCCITKDELFEKYLAKSSETIP